MPTKRRAYGSGSVSQRASDGLWIGSYDVGWTAKGTRHRIRVAAKTKPEAQRKLRDRIREIQSGAVPATVNTTHTVKSWSDEWLAATQRKLRPTTWATNAGAVRKWIVPELGRIRMGALTPAHLRQLAEVQEAHGLKPSSVLRTHAVFTSMLKAAANGNVSVPPNMLHAERPTKNESDRDAIPAADVMALLSAAGQQPDGSRWLVAFMQGTRQSETLGITWDAIDLDNGVLDVSWQLKQLPYADRAAGKLRVPTGYEMRPVWKSFCLVRTKTEHGKRIIPLIPPVVAALRHWQTLATPNPANLVWCRADGTPWPVHMDNARWVALQDAAQVAHVEGRLGRRYTGHETRHTSATLLMAAKVDVEVIKSILGHSTVVATKNYQHADLEMRRAALAAVGERLKLG